jgi:hypothetical protein
MVTMESSLYVQVLPRQSARITDYLCKYILITFGMLVYSVVAACLTTMVRFPAEAGVCSLPCLDRLWGPPRLLYNRLAYFHLKPTLKMRGDLPPLLYTYSRVRLPAVANVLLFVTMMDRLQGPPRLLFNRLVYFHLEPTLKICGDLSPLYRSSGVWFPAEAVVFLFAEMSRPTLWAHPKFCPVGPLSTRICVKICGDLPPLLYTSSDVRFSAEEGDFFFATMFRPALGPNQTPIK